MRWNPILVKELKTRARVVRIPILLMFYNAVVALIAVLMLLASADIFNEGKYVDYSVMTSLFVGLGILQCCIGFLVTLVLTAGSISTEREKGTLDLMLVTGASPYTVVGGKLFSAIMTSFLFAISSLPVLTIGTIFGGISIGDGVYLFFVFFLLSFYAGSIGILCSCFTKRSSLSVVSILIIEAGLMVGPFLLLEGVNTLFYSKAQGTLDALVSLGGWVFVHLINPGMLLMGFYDKVIGEDMISNLFFYSYGIDTDTALAYFLQKHFLQCCIGVQILISLILLWIAIKKYATIKTYE
ncbi:MAG: ABC transporter permease [Lachnospiraceae bacterium]|nr:ABC transporter permease [Lachnospiraceae bacterium]